MVADGSSQIRKQLETVVSPKSKLTKPIKKPKATWVEPKFTANELHPVLLTPA
jgi:bifunctional non-homologous end joining protein LigD